MAHRNRSAVTISTFRPCLAGSGSKIGVQVMPYPAFRRIFQRAFWRIFSQQRLDIVPVANDDFLALEIQHFLHQQAEHTEWLSSTLPNGLAVGRSPALDGVDRQTPEHADFRNTGEQECAWRHLACCVDGPPAFGAARAEVEPQSLRC